MRFAADKAKAVRGAHITRARVQGSRADVGHGSKLVNVSQVFAAQSQRLHRENAVEEALAKRLNQVAPETRRSRRMAAKAAVRRNHIVTGSAMAALMGAAAGAIAVVAPKGPLKAPLAAGDASSQVTPAGYTAAGSGRDGAVSRSEARKPEGADQQTSNQGKWKMDESGLDVSNMFKSLADNPVVAALMDRNRPVLPPAFNPNHATGDAGNAYEFSQCTWWAYVRRHQLGLPVGSHMGNGCQWAASARSLGYWVDNTPRNVGDVMVFNAGQEGTDPQYGHVAIVESINPDGSITTSECGVSKAGKTYSHTYTNIHDFQFIHY
ncbi:CHAP domain-containing protein [Bifidobacterium xylocopae]|uniref:CHAP domain-containing protein n=1 Tax=Bifidobacterium xylocopae TaxID=2493119 RepID=A0A366KFB7_9BIFI|nr:CHAP domain-containing protein [Bifidobacterium xylocopae]RBP99793.1 CHAP domain-containing protein [Bifidobacterium xylocopae]